MRALAVLEAGNASPAPEDTGYDTKALDDAVEAIEDGRFEDAEAALRDIVEPNVAECRWEQFVQHLRSAQDR